MRTRVAAATPQTNRAAHCRDRRPRWRLRETGTPALVNGCKAIMVSARSTRAGGRASRAGASGRMIARRGDPC